MSLVNIEFGFYLNYSLRLRSSLSECCPARSVISLQWTITAMQGNDDHNHEDDDDDDDVLGH